VTSTDPKGHSNHISDTSGFLRNCEELMAHSGLGSLQGIESNKDSIKNLYFAGSYAATGSFEIIFVSKEFSKRTALDNTPLKKDFAEGCLNNFADFLCFAFVCPMRDPDQQHDVHTMNIDFPTVVRTFERLSDDRWKFRGSKLVRSFEEYAKLQFKTIYGIP
jgi:hypothetical protein